MENKFVIAMTVYRRPDYTAQVLEALSKCYGIEKYKVFIHHDWNEEHQADCVEVERLCEEFQKGGFAESVSMFRHQPRLGCDLSKLFVLPLAYEFSDFVIFVEDDTVPACDFLLWMEFAADKIKGHPTIASVTGYSRMDYDTCHRISGAPYVLDIYRYTERVGFKPWTWGMWRERYDEFYGNAGRAYLETVDNVNGRFDWWIHDKGYLFMYPILARTQCIGGSRAEHTPSPEWFEANEYNPHWRDDVSHYGNHRPDGPHVWTHATLRPGEKTMDNE